MSGDGERNVAKWPAWLATGSASTSITGSDFFVCSNLFISLCAASGVEKKLPGGAPRGGAADAGRRGRVWRAGGANRPGGRVLPRTAFRGLVPQAMLDSGPINTSHYVFSLWYLTPIVFQTEALPRTQASIFWSIQDKLVTCKCCICLRVCDLRIGPIYQFKLRIAIRLPELAQSELEIWKWRTL
jgi:hypothetical protein